MRGSMKMLYLSLKKCRLSEGVFDIEDLKFRTNELADFVLAASKN